jgi:hypothetical protein
MQWELGVAAVGEQEGAEGQTRALGRWGTTTGVNKPPRPVHTPFMARCPRVIRVPDTQHTRPPSVAVAAATARLAIPIGGPRGGQWQ